MTYNDLGIQTSNSCITLYYTLVRFNRIKHLKQYIYTDQQGSLLFLTLHTELTTSQCSTYSAYQERY